MDLSVITDLLSNPWASAVLSFVAPFLCTMVPGLQNLVKTIFNALGYDIVPKAAPKQAIVDEMNRLKLSGTAWQDHTTPEGQRYAGLLDQLLALLQGGGGGGAGINPILLIGGGILAFVLLSNNGGCKPKPPTPPTPPKPAAAAVAEPAADLQTLVAPIKTLAAGKPDVAKRLAGFYAAGADVIGRDESLVSLSDFRNAKIRADRAYLAKTPDVGALPGIGAAVDAALAGAVGLEDVPMTACRPRLTATLGAVAWALGG